jgi:hypothetical protein
MRDDINKLPLKPHERRFARRGGLRSMMRQPLDAERVTNGLTGTRSGDKGSRDVVGAVPHAFNEEVARRADVLARQILRGQ